MVLWSYPPTKNQLAVTVAMVITGASLIAYGAHLSLVNVAPQQARTQARKDYVKQRLRRMLDD
ncbi:uncharacterized protein LOC126679279 [Mercurialis annua]|uniref:uncharacterized protein LOC126679279 n=1 Tax=Mercurialis annua TaxID=3986 RepID=UPI00215F1AC6|nr:uncharacterized protein LOC126679279 [Mercurialis annua]